MFLLFAQPVIHFSEVQIMGHKGVSKRKPPKAKVKPLATVNRGAGAVSSLAQPGQGGEQLPEKTRMLPSAQDGKNRSSGAKKKHKKQ